jgi:hypothetical protein
MQNNYQLLENGCQLRIVTVKHSPFSARRSSQNIYHIECFNQHLCRTKVDEICLVNDLRQQIDLGINQLGIRNVQLGPGILDQANLLNIILGEVSRRHQLIHLVDIILGKFKRLV